MTSTELKGVSYHGRNPADVAAAEPIAQRINKRGELAALLSLLSEQGSKADLPEYN